VRRGEIWSVAARGAYIGKPRPAVIVQDDRFDATVSVTVCALTTDQTEAPLFRLQVDPDDVNGLDRPSSLMVDKLTTVPRKSLGERIGRLGDEDVVRLDRAIVVFLGVA
jgi:mRNA interferase MazF